MADDEEYEVLDLSALSRNSSYINRILGDVSKQSAAQQVVIGGATGWATSYLTGKFGKYAGIGIGTSILLVRVAQHQGFIEINWNKVNREVNRARRKMEREATRQYPQVVDNLRRFFQQNVLLAGSFAGGFLIGMAF